jgi:superfamily II DNA helicase RecQ
VLESKFTAAFDGKIPYGWQIDVAEALILGIDCIVIAGTGAGKTMPFVMPPLMDNSKMKMVSPLDELQVDQVHLLVFLTGLSALSSQAQVERFRKMGLTATAVNADIYTTQLHKVDFSFPLPFSSRISAQEIENGFFQDIITSPEMCLEHPRFSQLIRLPAFTAKILSCVVDEAHCVSQCGESFRKSFSDLGKLRSFLAVLVPFLATSATLPPHVLSDLQRQLERSL